MRSYKRSYVAVNLVKLVFMRLSAFRESTITIRKGMNKRMKNQDIIVERTKELLSVRCYEGLRKAAEEWLEALGTEKEAEASKKYVAELEDAVTDIDSVISFFGSDAAKEKFGEENANKIRSHALEIKEKGAKWCDCPACTAGLKVLEYKADLLGE